MVFLLDFYGEGRIEVSEVHVNSRNAFLPDGLRLHAGSHARFAKGHFRKPT